MNLASRSSRALGIRNRFQVAAPAGQFLTDDVLQSRVPSIFATEAHESRSARFVPVPTIEVVRGLRQHGFDVTFAAQQVARDASRRDFTKHMLRLQNPSMRRPNGDAFEVIVVNGNDGSSAYHMIPGFFRFVCANGMIAGDKFEETHVRHSGRAVDDVIEGVYRVIEDAPRLTEQVEAFRGVSLSRDEAIAFATAAHELRYPRREIEQADDMSEQDFQQAVELEEARRNIVTPLQLLTARRAADAPERANLWGALNVVQENVIRGGQNGATIRAGKAVRATTRPVQGVDSNRALNRALWTLADEMAKIKAAA